MTLENGGVDQFLSIAMYSNAHQLDVDTTGDGA